MSLKGLFHTAPRKQEMRHPESDDLYRDIYNESDRHRGKRQTVSSKTPYYVAIAIIAIAFALLTSFIMSSVWQANASVSMLNFIHVTPPPSTVGGMLDIIFFVRGWSLAFYLVNIGFDSLISVYMMKNWHTKNLGRDPQNLNKHHGDARLLQPEELPQMFDIAPDAGMWFDRNVTAVLSHLPITNGDVLHHLKHISVAKRYQHDTQVPTIIHVPVDKKAGDPVVDAHNRIVYKQGTQTPETYKKDTTIELAKRIFVSKKRGDYIRDGNGNIEFETKPMIDEKFSNALLTTSFVPKDPKYRTHYDPFKLYYNPKNMLGKPHIKTVGQMINKTWKFPTTEYQRPGGMYIVDTQPDNTMVLAMTRAGKGQTIIEPTIDMWTRQVHKWNVVVNDPKGELYTEFYYMASERGYEVVAFNLINERRTSIYNPLGYAVEANRQGDSQKAGRFIASIGQVFFPADKADDPMWPNAANAAFKRSALGLIDFYQDEDNEMRDRANIEGWSQNELQQRLDKMWAHVTLYNVYQMMTQLASRKSSNLAKITFSKEEFQERNALAKRGQDESKDYLTLFFDALRQLPRNAIRTAAINQDNNLRSMAKSEKTLSSVYGISLTAMAFFTQPTIARLTSGRPSQNFDMEGMGFPRRIQVRFDHEYMKKHALSGQHYKWDAFKDPHFSVKDNSAAIKADPNDDRTKDPNPYTGPDFEHEQDVDIHGWVSYLFKGKFDNRPAYLRLRMFEEKSHIPMATYYFQFTKGFQEDANGETFVNDPVSGKRVIHGGILKEMQPVGYKSVQGKDGLNHKRPWNFEFGNTSYKKKRISLVEDDNDSSTGYKPYTQNVKAFSQVSVHYTERPKMVFMITPPHMAQYARIILILLDQMFNVQVSHAYMAKSNQKPLYGTNYMLDEVGNLRSNGKGIPFLQIKESIGLGQSQRYTLILQTVQQLKDVYGKSIDKILQGNTKNIIYLKSTDDSMIDLLSKMSGTRYRTQNDNMSTTTNDKKLVGKTDARISKSWSVKPEPLLPKNVFQLIPRDSSIVEGHGNPIWSQRQTALPMSWRLLKIQNSLHKYSLGNVPSTINNDDFDILRNTPNFFKMTKKRVQQAKLAPVITKRYKKAHGYTDADLGKMDDEVLSRALMQNINAQLQFNKNKQKQQQQANEKGNAANAKDLGISQEELEKAEAEKAMNEANGVDSDDTVNTDMQAAMGYSAQSKHQLEMGRYADGMLSKTSFIPDKMNAHEGWSLDYMHPKHTLNYILIEGYYPSIPAFDHDKKHFIVSKNNSLYSAKTHTPYILNVKDDPDYKEDIAKAKNASANLTKRDKSNVDDSKLSLINKFIVKDAFLKYLVSLPNWDNIAGGEFDQEVRIALQEDPTENSAQKN